MLPSSPRPVASVPSVPAAAQTVHIVVASKNQVKVRAARHAAEQCFAKLGLRVEVHHEEAPSGVSDQPWGDDETLQGALNRASAVQRSHPTCLVMSIEGGVGPSRAHVLQQQDTHMQQQRPDSTEAAGDKEQGSDQPLECFAWAVARDGRTGTQGTARSASFELPMAVGRLVNQGMELGAADDQVFKRTKSGQGSGTVGYLTQGLISRQVYYESAFALALIPFMNPELYPGTQSAG